MYIRKSTGFSREQILIILLTSFRYHRVWLRAEKTYKLKLFRTDFDAEYSLDDLNLEIGENVLYLRS